MKELPTSAHIPGLTISGKSASVVTGAQEAAPSSTLLLAPSLSAIHRREGLMSGDTRGVRQWINQNIKMLICQCVEFTSLFSAIFCLFYFILDLHTYVDI